MTITREEDTNKVVNRIIALDTGVSNLLRHSWAAPAAASNTYVHAAINSNAVLTTGITQPDFPRNITIVGAGSGHAAAGTVTINGTDIRGNAISEVLTLNGNTPVLGAKAFKTVTSIDMTAVTGNDTNDTVSVGIGVKLGIGRKMTENAAFLETVDGTPEVPSAVAFSSSNICNNTVTMLTAPNATHNYVVYYLSQDSYLPN